MLVEYKKNLRHNYMVLSDCENGEIEPFSIKMLKYQTIDGILAVEQRRLDNRLLLYYDITARQSMAAIYDKASLTKDKVQQLCTGIIDTLESAYDYLLPEDDFILTPEYIYMEVVSGKPTLCFLPGYNRGIKEQMSSLMEYLMNKVDYNDREAVLLVYRLYAVSREEGFTINHLKLELQDSPKLSKDISGMKSEKPENSMNQYKIHKTRDIQGVENVRPANRSRDMVPINDKANERETVISHRKIIREQDNKIENHIPVMLEKLEGEEEIPCYPLVTYIYTGACIAGGVILIILGFASKILYNSFGNRIDCVKLAALLLIIFCVEGYLLKFIWDKKNRITRIVKRNEYVDPRQEVNQYGIKSSKTEKTIGEFQKSPEEQSGLRQKELKAQNKIDQQETLSDNLILDRKHEFANKETFHFEKAIYDDKYDTDDNPTCLLNSAIRENTEDSLSYSTAGCVLKALDEDHYQSIPITDFPFFIGKLKKNVDYCLEEEVISRYHAKITKEEDRYYITDLNSTNGTFLNGAALQTYEKKEVKENDEIAFANIKYRLQLDVRTGNN